MRNDFVVRVPIVDDGLEHLHPLASNHGAAQPPHQLFALAREHGPTDSFNPSKIAGNKIHKDGSSVLSSSVHRFGERKPKNRITEEPERSEPRRILSWVSG